MAEYVALNPDVEVHISAVNAVVNSMDKGKESRIEILKSNGIDIYASEWFSQQDWLNSFKQIATSLGNMNIFLIGKAIIDNAQFPPINGLEEGLRSIDVAYHMNHRIKGKVLFDPETGRIHSGIGNYKLTKFDEANRRAEVVCNNPYPSEFDRGIITQVVRRFKPAGSREEVVLDTTKESRSKGADSCTYLISW